MDISRRIMMALVILSIALVGCGSDVSTPLGNDSLPDAAVSFAKSPRDLPGPGDFVAGIDNPYLGFSPGRVFRYEGETEDGLETIVVEVTNDTKVILGITATVVHDRVYLEGELIEDTHDWYAQDKDGNVWYLGEDSKEIENGVVVSTEGSWEAGVDGATAGINMLAQPKIGMQYYQEFYEDFAEDEAKVLSLSKSVEVPYGSFDGCLMTMEWTHLSPGSREFKYFAPGVGMLLEVQPRHGRVRVELVAVED